MNSKRYLSCAFLIACIGFSYTTLAQNYWMQRAGSSTIDEAYSISIDDSSNTYTTGYFTGNAGFGTISVTATGISDIFVAKTNAAGKFQWVEHAGGGSDRGLAIKTDGAGNSYVTGFYAGTATFGSSTITSSGAQDVFIAKYNRNGKLQWVKSAGGPLADIGNAITVDNSGNVVVAGEFSGTATFGSFSLTSSPGYINVFTTKLDANGNFLWAKSGTGKHPDRGLGVACDPSGNVYVTGQFTDTITFDKPHYSNLYDAIFLVKYDANGNEQWFTKAGGGTLNIANGIAIDNSSNIYLTGNFTGILTFFATTTTTLTHKYPDRIFVCKYDQNANLLWATADGSTNPVTANSISLDNSGNAYIVGNFECVMNSYADQYGQGTFNTVGYWDIFGAEYSSTGAWQWSRQIGGHKNNYAYGVTTSSSGDMYTAGSFDQDMIVAYNPSNYIGYSTPLGACNSTYCSDPYYGDYQEVNTAGNLDIYVAKPFDLTRQTYDFYLRNGSSCNRPQEGVCIDNSCPDTVSFCGSGTLIANPFECNSIAPTYNYTWSTKQTGIAIGVTTQGWYYVTQTSADGCFTSTDSIYVVIHPFPILPQPNLSDNVVINTNATSPKPIHICADSVRLTGGGFGSYAYNWSNGATTSSIKVTKSGMYCFNIYDTNKYGCVGTSNVCVQVTLDSAFKKIVPKLTCITCKNDTAAFCRGNSFTMLAYDSLTNPGANPLICIQPANYTTNYWGATPASTVTYLPQTNCPDQNAFMPSDSGWYHISDTIKRENLCDTMINIVTDSVFIRLYPVPNIGPVSISGKTLLCPGDSTLLIAHDTAKLKWSTGSTRDSIWGKPGNTYSISSSVTNSYGCTAVASASISIGTKTAPTITVSPYSGIICPGDSLQLTCSGAVGNFNWQGPTGPVGKDSDIIYVKQPGSYYCVVSDSNYCVPILSNTVSVNLYATPYLAALPMPVICPGDSVHISVMNSVGSVIQWQPPLSGSDSVQIITKPGTYTCKVISCGITTLTTLTITGDTPVATITASGSKTFCVGDSVTLTGNSGMAAYAWTPGNSSNPSITVDTAGVYTLVTTDPNGCHAKDTVHIKVQPNNVTPPLTTDTNVCPGSTVTLTASASGNIVWYDSLSGGKVIGTGSSFTTPAIYNLTTYYVQTDKGYCTSKRSPVNIDTTDCSGIYIPNVFTPNGDGKNDVWFITLKGAKCFECEIYNRWGVLVYIMNDPATGWNGIVRQSGLPASDGVYYYIVKYCNYEGQQFKKDGFLQLVRNGGK